MRKISISYEDVRWIRTTAIVVSIAGHMVVIAVLLYLQFNAPDSISLNNSDLQFRSRGGGGGLKLYEVNVEFGPQSGTQMEHPNNAEKVEKNTVKVEPKKVSDVGVPTLKSEKNKKKKNEPVFGANLPIKHHRGMGPGEGGGTGGGSGGGIGKSSGSSIDWGGTGDRRLLSGSLPSYPEGTNKELTVFLQFTVLPDGSVSTVIPLKKSDELLERAAITALKSWRFDPLPSQVVQKPQVGKISFKFKLE